MSGPEEKNAPRFRQVSYRDRAGLRTSFFLMIAGDPPKVQFCEDWGYDYRATPFESVDELRKILEHEKQVRGPKFEPLAAELLQQYLAAVDTQQN